MQCIFHAPMLPHGFRKLPRIAGQRRQVIARIHSELRAHLWGLYGPAPSTTLYAETCGGIFAITLPTFSQCLWGFYIDDHQGGGWELRLFLANIDTQQAHDYEVVVRATDRLCSKSVSVGPSGLAQFTCDDLQACGTAGWLYVQSDTPVFGATLFVINTTFGGGSFTAQPPVCATLP